MAYTLQRQIFLDIQSWLYNHSCAPNIYSKKGVKFAKEHCTIESTTLVVLLFFNLFSFRGGNY